MSEYIVTDLEIGSQPEDTYGEIYIRGKVNGRPTSTSSNEYLPPKQAAALLIEERKFEDALWERTNKSIKV